MAKEMNEASLDQLHIITRYKNRYGVELTISGATIVEQLQEGVKNIKELAAILDIAPKTVRYWLDKLLEFDLVKSIPNLNDMRSTYYQLV